MEEIKFCPHCGHANKGTSHFCEQCGARLDNEANPNIPNPEDSIFSQPKANQPAFNETPIVEKKKYNVLNFSQTLRRNLFLNPWPLVSGLVLFVLILASLLIDRFLINETDTYTYLNYIFLGLDIVYLFLYLIVTPLRTMSSSKNVNVENFHISFYRDRLRYELTMNLRGQEMRNDFFLMYHDICRVKEYKDMMILGFAVQGQLVPICLLKDDLYDRIIALMQDRIDQIKVRK
jgi:hypothetical protein